MALLAPLPPLVPPDGSGRVTPCPPTSRIPTTHTLAACQCAHPPHTVHCRGIDPALACKYCGMSEHLDRSVAWIELADLRRLAELAADAEAELFGRNRQGSGRYAGRLLGRALCQGAAVHYVDGRNGVKDFDVWSFYAELDAGRSRRVGAGRATSAPRSSAAIPVIRLVTRAGGLIASDARCRLHSARTRPKPSAGTSLGGGRSPPGNWLPKP